jgi:preprotein translocase subunit SecD
MAKNLRWKLLIIIGVVALAVYSFYPPQQRIRLGLDLKGGVHLVLRVQVDDAVRLETETSSDRLREQLRTAVPEATVTIVSPTEFRVETVAADKDQAFRQLLTDNGG